VDAPTDEMVDDALLEPARRIVRFVETRDRATLDGVFTDDVVLLESVAPFVFEGAGAVARWAEALGRHAAAHATLHGTLGAPQEFSRDGDVAFVSVPVTWTFTRDATTVDELGAMALLLRRVDGGWRVARYAWAVARVDAR
jgi:ketosteroid isomerase-like protein